MWVGGKSVEESAGAGGDWIDDFLAGDDGAERSVSAGEAFGGDQDVRRHLKMINGEVAAGAAHAGHDFVGDEQHAVTAADFGDALQMCWRRNDRAERRAADRFENKCPGFLL